MNKSWLYYLPWNQVECEMHIYMSCLNYVNFHPNPAVKEEMLLQDVWTEGQTDRRDDSYILFDGVTK